MLCADRVFGDICNSPEPKAGAGIHRQGEKVARDLLRRFT